MGKKRLVYDTYFRLGINWKVQFHLTCASSQRSGGKDIPVERRTPITVSLKPFSISIIAITPSFKEVVLLFQHLYIASMLRKEEAERWHLE